MRILILGSRESVVEKTGAIERLTYQIATYLVKKGCDVNIFTVGDNCYKRFTDDNGIEIHVIHPTILKPPSYIYPMLSFSKRANKELFKLIKEGYKFDVIYSVYYPNLLGFKNLSHTPIVISDHNPYPWKKEFLYIPNLSLIRKFRWEADCLIQRQMARILLRKANIVTCVSKAHKSWILECIGDRFQNRIEVIYNGVDINFFNPHKHDKELKDKIAPDGEKIIIYAGRKTPHKGFHLLIKILAELNKSIDVMLMAIGPISTSFVGEGYDPYINYIYNLIERYNLNEKVVFTGYIQEKDLPKYYCIGDIFAYPSFLEAFGLVVLEAMACGLPIVAWDVAPINEFVRNGRDGLLVPLGDINKFTECIRYLLSNERLRKQMGRNAGNQAEKFSLENMCKLYLEVFLKAS